MIHAKEKAEELVDKFKDYANDEYHECSAQYELTENIKKNAKKCAIIAVDEIISLRKGYFDCPNPMNDEKYWLEVKQEIERL